RRTTGVRASRRWREACSRRGRACSRALGFVLVSAMGAGCFYLPPPREDVNTPPQVVLPSQNPAIYPMILPENLAKVVVRDPDGDRVTAFWSVPGFPGPLNTSQTDDGVYTTFELILPRLEELHDQTVSVIVVDDDPDDPKSVEVEFTVKVL
ncbi:MAG: hypothetical protein AAF602_33735, partial [Myxococcota bacterium]